MTISPGTTLSELRERKPLVHQITNYVVMNETANATLALGALPVMAHAPQEVEEMVGLASALVLNIGTLSEHWIEAMLIAGTRRERAWDPGRARPGRRRRDRVPHRHGAADPRRGGRDRAARQPGRDRDARRRRGRGARRRVDVDRARAAALARGAARGLGVVASVTGPIDNVSDGERVVAVANGHPLLAAVTGTGCISTALTGCFLAAKPDVPVEAAAEALIALGVAAEDAAAGARGPGHVPRAALRRARGARSRDARRAGAHLRALTTLGELGELGLLAELERRGLAQGVEHDAAVVDGARRHAGRARRGRPLPLRSPRLARARRRARRRSTSAISPLPAPSRSHCSSRSGCRRRRDSTRCSSSTRA